ncbi:FAD-dependent oxidoreductase [Legionella israelensis]|uniref:FAD linked oxidase n=1 Tax=Legionella israelensis TaxID=454 RepID=A0A0W0V3C5_9GAMM|nr:FAD-binding protein [Legionella israelensis]KTD14397.1 FAD linked oxidase [Legionella israelensis]QBS10181.1 FAD-binding oxidoreductase [Legionella israelensis]SCY35266.1 FAD/FMN-containing dehydrogenase [Legionella israelensis DSM 19235]STX59772.1 FAD linked oxidase [Legionella israelensis]
MTPFQKLSTLGILLFIYLTSHSLIAAESFSLQNSKAYCRCQPQDSCWPKAKEWATLEKQLTGQLIKPVSAITPCKKDKNSEACKNALKHIYNPFFLSSNPGNAQSQGWLNAWIYQNSNYAVEAVNTKDIVEAVNFARQHRLRIVIKGTGHDYLGRSNARDSLLIWTHKMNQVQFDPAFVPKGCTIKSAVPALRISAGTQWLQAYDEATNKHGRYVQGGGCTTVGAAGGFTQGGGFGSFSKRYGTGAAGVLQAEVVTADGQTLIANACQNQDLFWAVRGGGAGTFGVISHLTLKTHALPPYTAIFQGTITSKNDEAYKKLLPTFLSFYRDKLNNEHWGEQITFTPDNQIQMFMVFQGESQKEAEEAWQPMKQWLNQRAHLYTINSSLWTIPSDKIWNINFWQKSHPDFIKENELNDASSGQFWWAPNSREVYTYWYTYQSWWLPASLFEDSHLKTLSNLFFRASRLASVGMHINKGLAGAAKTAIIDNEKTSINPAVHEAAALIIMAAGSNKVYTGVKGLEPDKQHGEKIVERINKAMALFRNTAPEAGTYVNEADYFEKNWQRAFWGKHYQKLLKIKQKYDPTGLFYCHHCVGSEFWSPDGLCRKKFNP